jgi:hypothetical protein
MTYPLISAKCITYGRVSTLEESIYSFINQDYPGPKELIIVNDYPLQTLFFDHPEVKIYNLNSTFSTLGEKENFATMLCRGDIICQWDDDDVALPNHLSNVEKYFVPGTEIMHWERGILVNSGEISAISGLGNSGIVYSKKAWEESGKYPLENAGYDMSFVVQLHRREKVISAAPPDSEVSWIYYWGDRSYHCSGMGADTEERANVIIRHSDYIESERVKGNIPTGNVFLQPKWNINYIKKHRDFIKNNMKNYCIKNYSSRISPAHHDDSNWKDESQYEVYQYCSKFMKEKKLSFVVDIGCGSAYKLIKYLSEYKTIGTETEPCYSLLNEKYPDRDWFLSGKAEVSFQEEEKLLNADVVLCCDVIEHIIDPDILIDFLLSLKAKYYIISTPCREILCHHPRFSEIFSKVWNGPPLNPCHVREWTKDEFVEYISNKFNVIESFYGEQQIECQYHLLTIK